METQIGRALQGSGRQAWLAALVGTTAVAADMRLAAFDAGNDTRRFLVGALAVHVIHWQLVS